MFTESCPSMKINGDSDNDATPNNTFVLDDDLALSSSTLGENQRPMDKSLQESETFSSDRKPADEPIYINEDTMDCNYSAASPNLGPSRTDVSSPEMFESDDDEQTTECNIRATNTELERTIGTKASTQSERCERTDEERVFESDRHLLSRMNKFLTGVPPPPKHTICQSDCSDFLVSIRQNREYFLVDPLPPCDENTAKISTLTVKVENIRNPANGRSFDHRAKSSLRNLTNAFDACDRTADSVEGSTTRAARSNADSAEISENPKEIVNLSLPGDNFLSGSHAPNINPAAENYAGKNTGKHVTFNVPKEEIPHFYSSISVAEATNLDWECAYKHKTHGIHYNRSESTEEFESLSLKFCQRYIGAETQSSCNIWFTKQAPPSVKKRNLLSRRNNGQSPGKRLSHLARRRRTFSSANLQVLGMADKKQLVLNIKKPTMRKGKSPRGKSPRGKSPRGKSPRGKSSRGSAKKRASLRPSPSPRKSKLETSKRALFQSPPNDRAGPSGRLQTIATSNPQQRIKRALFTASRTNEDTPAASSVDASKTALPFEESRKRKNEDELEGPRFKWAKSLSFDCAHGLESNSAESWSSERHSTGSFLMKSEAHLQQANKCELSETHRKKLLWAVAEALRSRGIVMGHPRFKECAPQLAKTVKKYMPDLENRNVPRKPGSTSDRMLKLAKQYVLLIVESANADGK